MSNRIWPDPDPVIWKKKVSHICLVLSIEKRFKAKNELRQMHFISDAEPDEEPDPDIWKKKDPDLTISTIYY